MEIKGKVGKYIMREAIRPWVPATIVSRPTQAFQIPLAEWFGGDLGTFARDA